MHQSSVQLHGDPLELPVRFLVLAVDDTLGPIEKFDDIALPDRWVGEVDGDHS